MATCFVFRIDQRMSLTSPLPILNVVHLLASRAGKIFTFLKKFFRRPFGEVKIKIFFKKIFQESIKTDVFQNAKNTMILKVFASTTKAVQKRNEFKRFLHSVLHGRIVQKPQQNKGFCDIRFQKYYDFQCFEAFWWKTMIPWLSGKKFSPSAGRRNYLKNFRKLFFENFFGKKFSSPGADVQC